MAQRVVLRRISTRLAAACRVSSTLTPTTTMRSCSRGYNSQTLVPGSAIRPSNNCRTALSLMRRRMVSSTSFLWEDAKPAEATTADKVAADSEMFDDHDSVPSLPPISPESKRLFLVRHGEVINPGGDRPVYYGALDVSLSPLGEQEARAAGEYLRRFELQHVAASPLSRAIFGANQVLDRQQSGQDKELAIFDGFKELDRGEWCGLTLNEIGRDKMARFDDCDESVTPPNGESFPALKKRVLQAGDVLLSMTDKGKCSAVVSHLQVTRSILSEALGVPIEKMSGLKIATASITCIDYDESTGKQIVHFQSFKPEAGLEKAKDMAN